MPLTARGSKYNDTQRRHALGVFMVLGNFQATSKRSTTRKVNAIDKNIKLNKALWSMAEQMRDLKG